MRPAGNAVSGTHLRPQATPQCSVPAQPPSPRSSRPPAPARHLLHPQPHWAPRSRLRPSLRSCLPPCQSGRSVAAQPAQSEIAAFATAATVALQRTFPGVSPPSFSPLAPNTDAADENTVDGSEAASNPLPNPPPKPPPNPPPHPLEPEPKLAAAPKPEAPAPFASCGCVLFAAASPFEAEAPKPDHEPDAPNPELDSASPSPSPSAASPPPALSFVANDASAAPGAFAAREANVQLSPSAPTSTPPNVPTVRALLPSPSSWLTDASSPGSRPRDRFLSASPPDPWAPSHRRNASGPQIPHALRTPPRRLESHPCWRCANLHRSIAGRNGLARGTYFLAAQRRGGWE